MNKLGDYLRRRRGSLSLRDFAKQCGISHTHLDSLEKGFDPRTGKPVRVTTDTLKNIADGLGVDYLYLSGLAENIDVSSRIAMYQSQDLTIVLQISMILFLLWLLALVIAYYIKLIRKYFIKKEKSSS